MKEIKPEDIWNKEKLKQIGVFILTESKKQTPEQKEYNNLLGKKFKKEDNY
jgi:hypothetical protein